jgi:KaiC/GvpD/RAD55 family RecA-like ATPase
MDELDRARSALQSLNPGCPREEWLRILMAAKAAGVPVADCIEWSKGGANFKSDADVVATLRSIKPGSIGAGTLFYLANEAGWSDPARNRKTPARRVQPPWKGAKHTLPAKATPKPAIDAVTIWARCEPATDTHPYITVKNGLPDGLRVVPEDDTLTIFGQCVAGWLVVPAASLAGDLRSLQFIPPNGDKLNLPGARFDDGLFVVGNIAESARIFIVEGIGQAWACWRATGSVAVVSFGAGRLARVAEAMRREHPDCRIVIVPDRGKEAQAQAIARRVHGEWVELPSDKPLNYDANDYAAQHGSDVLAHLLDKAQSPALRYRLLAANDLANQPPMEWLVRGVLPAQGVAAIYGASGSGKSFLALDLCAAVAEGAEWFGRRVKSAPVVYVVLEGEAGFRQRVRAWEKHHGRPLPSSLRFIFQPFDLRSAEDVAHLVDAAVATVGPRALVVIDTLSRAAPAADENSSADMGAIIDGAKSLQAKVGGLTTLVHHTGKDETKGLRGHSSLIAALDAAIEVKRISDRREWRIFKTKDESDETAHPFRLEVLEVATHEDGDPIRSCAVVPEDAPASIGPKLPSGPTQNLVYEALGRQLRASPHYGKAGAPLSRPCVELEAAIPELAGALPCRPDQRPYQARRAVTSMAAKGIIQTHQGWIWLP